MGNLTIWDLQPGKRLFLFSTGTGLAPFGSILRDPDTYEKFDEIILTHTCRYIADLEYGIDLINECKKDLLCGSFAKEKLKYYPTTTRENSLYCGRITNLIYNGRICNDLKISKINEKTDRIMICGSIAMVRDTINILHDRGFKFSFSRHKKTLLCCK